MVLEYHAEPFVRGMACAQPAAKHYCHNSAADVALKTMVQQPLALYEPRLKVLTSNTDSAEHIANFCQ